MSDSGKVSYCVTIGDVTDTRNIPAETPIKTERGELRADQLKSGEYGQLWGQPNNEAWQWIAVQRAYFFSVRVR